MYLSNPVLQARPRYGLFATLNSETKNTSISFFKPESENFLIGFGNGQLVDKEWHYPSIVIYYKGSEEPLAGSAHSRQWHVYWAQPSFNTPKIRVYDGETLLLSVGDEPSVTDPTYGCADTSGNLWIIREYGTSVKVYAYPSNSSAMVSYTLTEETRLTPSQFGSIYQLLNQGLSYNQDLYVKGSGYNLPTTVYSFNPYTGLDIDAIATQVTPTVKAAIEPELESYVNTAVDDAVDEIKAAANDLYVSV